jgi:hypothetical protein
MLAEPTQSTQEQSRPASHSEKVARRRPSVEFPERASFARRLRIICFVEALGPALEPLFEVGIDFSAGGNGSKIANQVVDLLHISAQQV